MCPSDNRDANDPLLGTVFADRYQIQCRLGKGGMAVVYKAVDRNLGRDVALKVLRTDVAPDPVAAKRLIREARAAASLHHPHIITMHDVGERDGIVFVVMEVLVGKAMSDLMEEQGAVSVERAIDMGEQIASALVVAHHAGIVHRDIKPENLFLIEHGSTADFVKMLDFSIAKLPTQMVTAALTRAGSVFGTPHYMAPEQVEGKPAVPQTDLYALGAVLYELIMGEPPYDGPSVIDILLKHVKEPPPHLARPGLRLPTGLNDLVQQLLAKKPGNRPESAQIVRERLGRMLAELRAEDASGQFAQPTMVSSNNAAIPSGAAPAAPTSSAPRAVGNAPAAAPVTFLPPGLPGKAAAPAAETPVAIDVPTADAPIVTPALLAARSLDHATMADLPPPMVAAPGSTAPRASDRISAVNDVPIVAAPPTDLPAGAPTDLPDAPNDLPNALALRRFASFGSDEPDSERTMVGVGVGLGSGTARPPSQLQRGRAPDAPGLTRGPPAPIARPKSDVAGSDVPTSPPNATVPVGAVAPVPPPPNQPAKVVHSVAVAPSAVAAPPPPPGRRAPGPVSALDGPSGLQRTGAAARAPRAPTSAPLEAALPITAVDSGTNRRTSTRALQERVTTEVNDRVPTQQGLGAPPPQSPEAAAARRSRNQSSGIAPVPQPQAKSMLGVAIAVGIIGLIGLAVAGWLFWHRA